MSSRRSQLVAVGLVFIVAISLLLFFSLNPLSNQHTRTDTSGVSCSSYQTNFLVVANERGFNDSIDHGVPSEYWPVLCVHQGQSITITVENQGTEPHGFAVGHYFEAGTSLPQGTSFVLKFNATAAGSFLIYCTILCAVHPWMLNGLLVVN